MSHANLGEQVKNLYLGKDHVGDAPLLKKIAAGLTTGCHSFSPHVMPFRIVILNGIFLLFLNKFSFNNIPILPLFLFDLLITLCLFLERSFDAVLCMG